MIFRKEIIFVSYTYIYIYIYIYIYEKKKKKEKKMILAPYMTISCDAIVKLTTCWSHIVGVHFGEFFPCWNINQKRRRTTTPLFSFSHFLSFSLSFSPLLHQYHIHLAIFPGGLLRIHRTNNGYL